MAQNAKQEQAQVQDPAAMLAELAQLRAQVAALKAGPPAGQPSISFAKSGNGYFVLRVPVGDGKRTLAVSPFWARWFKQQGLEPFAQLQDNVLQAADEAWAKAKPAK